MLRLLPTIHASPPLAVGALLLGGAFLAPARQDSEEGLEFFESKVRPVLVEHCYSCHSSQAPRLKAELALDTREGLLAGGRGGALFVAGDVEASALIAAVRYRGDPQMPPDGPLDARDVAILEEWVRRGAPLPRGESVADSSATAMEKDDLWSLGALGDPKPPAVRDEDWCRNEIDRFVLAAMTAQGLEPAPRASRATLLRRASFDLTGLPPTAEEIAAFEADPAPDAWERRVDALLHSPHYGERQARAWLDLARYSDSNGLDENLSMSNAWRYRDWVVRAFDSGLSYDRFLTWQLAGDLIEDDPDSHLDRLTATGFLVLGPKMLAEQDKAKLTFDVVDEQIDVAFRVFQGMTLGCARCHDHKFDPISQQDYTAVAAIFKSTRSLANLDFVSRWNERELALPAALAAREAAQAERDAAASEVRRLRESAESTAQDAARARIGEYLAEAARLSRGAILVQAEDHSRGNLIRDDSTYGTARTVIARTGAEGLQHSEYDLTFEQAGARTLLVRFAAEESRPVRVSIDGETRVEAALGEVHGSWRPDGMVWVDVGRFDFGAGRSVLRFERDGAMPHLDAILLLEQPIDPTAAAGDAGLDSAMLLSILARMEAASSQHDALLDLFARFASSPSTGIDHANAAQAGLIGSVLDGDAPTSLDELGRRAQRLFGTVDRLWAELRAKTPDAERLESDSAQELRRLIHGDDSALALSAAEFEPRYADADRIAIAAAREVLKQREAALPMPFERALGVADGEIVAGLGLMRRGSHLDAGKALIPRGVPTRLAPSLATPALPADRSGRLELARWMLDSEHPLTSRVAANRIWQGLFGVGIVRTPSNFGHRGEAPSHPELLDWLARDLQRNGWSIRSLQRKILLSNAYACSSEARDDVVQLDPDNRWFSRRSRRRLEAEELRDAILAVGGLLDRSVGGSLLSIENGAYATNDQSKDAAAYDSPRRSIYLPIIRNSILDLFSAFDYPDPSVTLEARPQTASASQALYLMNAPLPIDVARGLARDAIEREAGDRGRAAWLIRRVLARDAREHELSRASAFVAAVSSAAAPSTPMADGEVVAARASADVGGSADAAAAAEAAAMVTADDPTLRAWSLFAQALLISNEFLYVE